MTFIPISNEDIKKIENKENNIYTSTIVSENLENEKNNIISNNTSIKINNLCIKSKNIKYDDIKYKINCWWCTLNIEGKIFGIPEYFKIINDEIISLIYLMRNIIFNINNIKIQDIEILPAKSKYVLDLYGGNITVEEYKKDILLISKDNNYIFPIFYQNNNIEENNKKNINKNEYKLKRSKPLQNNLLYKLLYNKNN